MSLDDSSAISKEAYAHCEALVKAADRTAWLGTLFAPQPVRPSLLALRAFLIEIEAVRGKVREPLAGELRLQWWVDAIEGEARGDVQGNPVAVALLDTVGRFGLPRSVLTGLIEARRTDLYDEAPADFPAFDLWAECTEGAAIELALPILGAETEDSVAAARHAGRVLGVAKSIVALGPSHGGRMAVHLPGTVLAQCGLAAGEIRAARPTPEIASALAAMHVHAEEEYAALRKLRPSLPDKAAPAFLGLSIAMRRLKLLRKVTNPFAPPPDLPQWRKQWIMWRAAGRKGIA